MANTTKISNYRLGPMRFGTRDSKSQFDNSVKISYLSPEELEEYRSGKRGGKNVNAKVFTHDEYLKLKNEGKSKPEIAKEAGISLPTLYSRLKVWGEPMNAKPHEEQQEKEQPVIRSKEVLPTVDRTPELNKEILKLKSFLANKDKMISEKDKEIDFLQKQLEEANQKPKVDPEEVENLKKEVAAANEVVFSLQEQLNRIRKTSSFVEEKYESLLKEVAPLRTLAYLKLKRDVEDQNL